MYSSRGRAGRYRGKSTRRRSRLADGDPAARWLAFFVPPSDADQDHGDEPGDHEQTDHADRLPNTPDIKPTAT
jgi:hypothetical protein